MLCVLTVFICCLGIDCKVCLEAVAAALRQCVLVTFAKMITGRRTNVMADVPMLCRKYEIWDVNYLYSKSLN